jgi:uncharacterized alpha-E superfamily protein
MLSRVAERLYWLARYAERAENSARLINVYSNVLLDLPKGAKLGWGSLITIAGTEEFFGKSIAAASEKDVLQFLIADRKNPSSIISTLSMARENARITRDIMPSEVWEIINNLYLYANDNLLQGVSKSGRTVFLSEIIAGIQQFTGFLIGSMSHNTAYEFIKFGRNLERADMTTRIVDAGAETLLGNLGEARIDEALNPYSNILWMNILRSLSAYQMYRQHVRDKVQGEEVVSFLLKNRDFPRSVNNCLERLQACLNNLPNSSKAMRVVSGVKRKVEKAKVNQLIESELHDFLDIMQMDIASIHYAIAETWFSHAN